MRNSNDLLSLIHDHDCNPKLRIIYIDSEIDEKSASSFIKNLDHISSLGDSGITVKILSNGGCTANGMAIYDAIAGCKNHITTISAGQATSMSSLIPQAADERVIQKHCYFMAHFGYAFFDDNFKATKSGVDFHNRTFCDYLISIYSKRAITGKHFKINNMQDEKRIAKFLRDKFEKHVDWYLEAEEAVYYGLMDRVE